MIKIKNLTATFGLLLLCSFFQNASAQCTDDTHSTNPADGWASCQTSMSPNPNRGIGHWLLYDLGYDYNLGTITLWNHNVTGETDQGFKIVNIDYSSDGITWMEGATFQLPEATGQSDYSGYEGPDLGDVLARYVLIFAQTTWSTSDCAGLAEFKVAVNNMTTLAVDVFDFTAKSTQDYIALNWRLSLAENVDYFELERSTNAQDFYKIAVLNHYNYKDKKVERGQLYYYRLKIWDKEGVFEYSPIRKAQLQEITEIVVFPNPVKNVLTVDWDSMNIQELILQNASGHELKRWTTSDKRIQIDVSSFPSGLYFLQMRSRENNIYSQRFVKMD